jgi:hypothetical protein
MLVVKIELHNANTGEISEIGRMTIANVGGTVGRGDYEVRLAPDSFCGDPSRSGSVKNYPRIGSPVWLLVARALAAVGLK